MSPFRGSVAASRDPALLPSLGGIANRWLREPSKTSTAPDPPFETRIRSCAGPDSPEPSEPTDTPIGERNGYAHFDTKVPSGCRICMNACPVSAT